jgi:xanthine dehydrogenase small subunit
MENNLEFILNNEIVRTDSNSATVLLDFIRNEKHLTGTKSVCKEGDCGACAVLIGTLTENGVSYKSVNSCIYPLQNAAGKHIVTIEGLNNNKLSPIQKSFADEGASQCGFCTPGFIVSTTNYFLNETEPDIDEAIDIIAGNVCRCTGYNSIKKAVSNLVDEKYLNRDLTKNKIDELIRLNILPEYFSTIESKLKSLKQEYNPVIEYSKNIIAGGTDLFVQKPEEMLKSNNSFISEKNKTIYQDNDKIMIGASATINDLMYSEVFNNHFPNLNNFYNLFASHLIRNTATIGGNIVNASPIGDSSVLFLSLNAKLSLTTGENNREILLKEFYTDYKTTELKENEIIEKIILQIPGTKPFISFEKVSKREHLDIASVNTAMALTVDDNVIKSVSISAGGVAPVPLYLQATSEYLKGKQISNELIKEVVTIVEKEISPISDIRGSKEYKTLLLTQLIKAHFLKLFPHQISHEVLL